MEFARLTVGGKTVHFAWIKKVEYLDELVGEWIQSIPIPTPFAVAITHMGSVYVELLVLFAMLVLLFKRRAAGWKFVFWIAAYGGVQIANRLLKELFQRERPNWERLVEAQGYSFPSGHAMVSAALYGLIGYFISRHLHRTGKSAWPAAALTIALVLCIGMSRVYLGVHYPSDVAAGFVAGGLWLMLSIRVYHFIKY